MDIRDISIDLSRRPRLQKILIGEFNFRKKHENRQASFPFVSGDTFRSISDYVIDVETDIERLLTRITRSYFEKEVLFCEVARLEDLVHCIDKFNLMHIIVLVHNGDVIDVELVRKLSTKVDRIYCVNWLEDRTIAEPIPIGIENAHWSTNGKLNDMVEYYEANLSASLARDRPVTCFQAFKKATNPEEREKVSSTFQNIEGSVTFRNRISRSKFKEMLNRSKFVISPPGNGPDCHRTWEAMYAGAVPVVLNRAWPFGHLNLPVLSVESWPAAEELLSGDSKTLYNEIWARAERKRIYFPFYQNEIWTH